MKPKSLFLKTAQLIIIVLFFSIPLVAQNHLYTTEQFGVDGAILGGAITAGCNDVSMTFYNPAAIHKVAPQINVSLLQPAIRTFGFNEFWANDDSNQPHSNVRLKPTLVSFKLKLKKVDLAFLKLTKSEIRDTFDATREITNNNLSTTQYFDYEYRGRDNWYGVGTNFKITPNLYFGLSQFVSIARFTYQNIILLEEFEPNQNNQLNRYFASSFDGTYSNMSLITKFGLLLDTDKHDLGLTVTTPTYSRINKGGEFFKANVNTINNNTNVDQVIDNDISPIIRTPWEVNFGYSLTINTKNRLWFNSSFHSEIAEYDMVKKESSDANINWKNGSKSVCNFSMAYSHNISSNFQLSGGIRTNNFAYENKLSPEESVRNIIFDGNHLHYVIGAKLEFNRNTVLLGVDYSTLNNVPDEENFGRLSNLEILAPNLEGLQKTNLSILLTYRFIINEIKRLGSN